MEAKIHKCNKYVDACIFKTKFNFQGKTYVYAVKYDNGVKDDNVAM